MNQNTTINPHTGLKIAKPCFYEKKVAPRAEPVVARTCEYTKAKPNKSYQIKATQGRGTTYYGNSSNSLTWPTLLLAIIFVPIAFVWFVLKFFHPSNRHNSFSSRICYLYRSPLIYLEEN